MRSKGLYAEVEYKYIIKTLRNRTSLKIQSMGRTLDVSGMSIDEKQLAVDEISRMLKMMKKILFRSKIKNIKFKIKTVCEKYLW